MTTEPHAHLTTEPAAMRISTQFTYRRRITTALALALMTGCAAVGAPVAGAVEDTCPNAAIRAQQHSVHLLDCRAYEQVSPTDKAGRQAVAALTTDVLAAVDGNAAVFQSSGSFGDAQSSVTVEGFVAHRSVGGWSTHSPTDNRYPGTNVGVEGLAITMGGWSDDLSVGMLFAGFGPALAPGGVAGAKNSLYRYDVFGRSFQTVSLDPGTPVGDGLIQFTGGSADLSTVTFESPKKYTADSPPASHINPYVWRNGSLSLVSILPDPDGAGPGAGAAASDGAVIGAGAPYNQNAVSKDGSRIAFSTPDGRIYVRLDGVRTLEVSAAQKSVPDVQQAARYWMSTPDGSKVFFTTAEQLLDSDTDSDSDVYRYDVVSRVLVRISAGVAGGGSVVSGVSDDGSYVYFDGHVWHNGTVRVTGSLSAASIADPAGTPRVSADGSAMAYTDRGAVYLYDYPGDTLSCASCHAEGGVQMSNATQPYGKGAVAGNSSTFTPRGEPQSLSADGRRVFFTSGDPLVREDTNGQPDAYMFMGGKPYLISSGRSPKPARFLTVSRDGHNAFFSSNERLVPTDTDESKDLYDARVDGGFAAPVVSPECAGDACQGLVTAVEPAPVVGSVAFTGRGNGSPSRAVPVVSQVSVSRSVSGTSARLRVKVPTAGRILVSGAAVARSSRSAGRAATYTVRLGLTRNARQRLIKHRSLKTKVTVRFISSTGQASSASVSLVFARSTGKAGR